MFDKNRYLLDVKKGKCHCFPKIVTVLAGDLKVLVEFLLYQWVVLHRDRVPHEIFLQNKIMSVHCIGNDVYASLSHVNPSLYV